MNIMIECNGTLREATPEEAAEIKRMEEEIKSMHQPTPEERIRDLEEALDLLLSGGTE